MDSIWPNNEQKSEDITHKIDWDHSDRHKVVWEILYGKLESPKEQDQENQDGESI